MTQEEKESLQLIAYRLTQLEVAMTTMKQDCAHIGQILSKLRLDEQVLSDQKDKIREIEHRQIVTDKKQDHRIEHLESIVLPSHTSWSDTAIALKGFMVKITGGVITAVVGMAGLVGLK